MNVEDSHAGEIDEVGKSDVGEVAEVADVG